MTRSKPSSSAPSAPSLGAAFAVAALAITVSSAPRAQVEATTLSALAHRADTIAVVHTDATPHGNGSHLGLTFVSERVLKGRVGGTFALHEPNGRCCGRALHGVVPGRYLVFLSTHKRAATPTLAVSGSRGMVTWSSARESHVRALLGAPDDATRVAVLARALGSADSRVRADAAASLPHHRGLERASGADRALLRDALRRSLAPGAVDPRMAPPLVVAAGRLAMAETLDVLVPAYLSGDFAWMDRIMVRGISRCGADAAARRTARLLPGDPAGRARACELLASLEVAAARQALEQLAGENDRATAHRAGVALRRHHGVSEAWLRQKIRSGSLVDKVLRDAAEQRPQFRAILRGGPR